MLSYSAPLSNVPIGACQVERLFGLMKRSYGYARVRYRGLAHNRAQLLLMCMAINLRRADRLLGRLTGQTPRQALLVTAQSDSNPCRQSTLPGIELGSPIRRREPAAIAPITGGLMAAGTLQRPKNKTTTPAVLKTAPRPPVDASHKSQGAERLETRLRSAEDQRMDVVSSFISVDRFEVHDVADDVKLVNDAVAAVHVAREPGDVERLAAGVALDERNALRGRSVPRPKAGQPAGRPAGLA